ncbi:hypothetical protein CLG96_04465 [Sphingomonas oleivorans]|uniref:DNA-binding protein n=1 Tax=Sphingomonas oleivorans TaxID=1735121 RepID=A0A2T5G2I3_9SPHN|nr:DUF177 domain-containing protein [Sphingomonas oleivorans]PTQ13357.1 hypothetical protein CLG96_04465 [Sphingomonas oleivorans]
MIENEFSRPVRLDILGDAPRRIEIEADEAERAALARRFGLVAIGRLEAEAALTRIGSIVSAEGRLRAEAVQSCVATGNPLPAMIDTAFSLRFVPEEEGEQAEEIELSEADCDVVTYEGGAVDLGEAAAETLALSLDPFPRSSDADAVLKAAGVLEEGEAGPFGALKALKEKLGE